MDHSSGQNRSGQNKAQAPKDSGAEAESHRLTLDLSRAETLAAMLAHSRASQVIEVADLVAGMYLYDWDRLSKYWDYEDQERVEDLLRIDLPHQPGAMELLDSVLRHEAAGRRGTLQFPSVFAKVSERAGAGNGS